MLIFVGADHKDKLPFEIFDVLAKCWTIVEVTEQEGVVFRYTRVCSVTSTNERYIFQEQRWGILAAPPRSIQLYTGDIQSFK